MLFTPIASCWRKQQIKRGRVGVAHRTPMGILLRVASVYDTLRERREGIATSRF
ncbi:MAG: hypothetical protein V7K26_05245 [Nostoc sp.]|uniref:hypothetical protein n=1 Tax=Nostoc sp. TaxID=1180 RepID=UPI002FEF032D